MSKWHEVLAEKMMSEYYKGNNFHEKDELHWVCHFQNVIEKGNWESGVLRGLQEYDHLEVVRHWIYIIKMFVPKVEDHYTEEEYNAMQIGVGVE